MLPLLILAGGLGTRLSEYTETIPKPMITIGGKPIISHIINYYVKFGVSDVYIGLGYKKKVIIDYFKKNSLNFYKQNQKHSIANIKVNKKLIKINLVDTGIKTMTGGRVKRLIKFIKDENFFLTYGDGLANVNLKKLLNFHFKNQALMTLTAVHPPARFGYVKLKQFRVESFREKSQIDLGWINGGFFVVNRKINQFIKDDNTFLEKNPMERLSKKGKLYAFKHRFFWQCMDTKRDRDLFEDLFKQKKLSWLK